MRRKAPPPRQAKAIDYTPRPRDVVQPSAAPCVDRMVLSYPKDLPVRDEAYRRLVAALPCIHCGRRGRSQAAHGPTLGMAIKASDLDLFPLCADEPGRVGCHTKFDRYELFDADQRREMAASWSARTRATIDTGKPPAGSSAATESEA
jgi:hypothetical protein